MANSAYCTSSHCSRIFLTYQPSLAGGAVFLSLFAVLIPITLALGVKYRCSVFATVIATGLALEVVGYIGRVLLHNSPTDRTSFILFLLGTLLGSTLIGGAMFIVMPQIVTVYGEEFRSWRPVWYLFLFYAFTAVSLVLQLAGGIVSTVQDEPEQVNTGIRVLVVGLAIQLVSLVLFIGHAMLFAIALRTRRHRLDIKFASIYNSMSYKAFLFAFSFATVLLLIRTAFRIVVIAEGYGSSVAQSETLLLVFDGMMVLLSTLILLAFFPGRVLGASWSETSTQRLPKTQLQPIRATSYELPSTRSSPTYNQMSFKSPTMHHSHYPAPAPRSGLVDSEALW
ncbi:RTA1 like protein-domain-containing protein [Hypomontagnella monticulosa]|nr:RTA1 like protein-domain-containing protein [Hypomontagnella monticulosa]